MAVEFDTVVKVERKHPRAQLPTKAHPSDACFDLVCVEGRRLEPGDTQALETGLCIELEEGWEAQIRGRSGLASRGIVVHCGTIDHLYRQTLKVLVHNLSGRPYIVQAGDRIAQMKIDRVYRVQLTEAQVEGTNRGGLGSTGR